MSLNVNGRIVENKTKYVNEQGGSKLTYNFVTDSRLKRGHNFGIIYVTSSNYDETSSLKSPQRKKDSKNFKPNLKNKNYLGQIKEKEDKEKKKK